ncbi:TetR/AcrR family transcriptional regulator [Paenibacillus dendritiformis]|uniref:TetR/AcrR family transcriptional regulator n=1 Tax=Paenibacillus dendritiformis TaxID=130049 RepID=UPI00143D2572|nr:TetR/AcrR family transcriptional regulator [Paenibacillus dendritiformis]NKI22440.1 TetR/AcrR family transcriptional regulator [Paenibacillus dendritiformis]NRF97480.1 TetR/AcrR family transcriptional regulator [Paenibacillus dendritiformis]
MRISKKPEERRNEILDAAELLFTTKGFSKTTVNDILHMVGIAKGAFYYYFQSKEEVMDAIVMRFIDFGVEAAKAVAAHPELTAHDKIFQIMMSQQPDAGRKEQMIEQLHQVNNAEMHQKSLIETILQLTPVLTEVIEQGIAEGVFDTPYPKETVEFLLVSSQFIFDEGIFQWQPDELMTKAIAFTSMMEKMLGAEKGSFDYMIGKFVRSLKNGNSNEN